MLSFPFPLLCSGFVTDHCFWLNVANRLSAQFRKIALFTFLYSFGEILYHLILLRKIVTGEGMLVKLLSSSNL